MKKIKTEKEYAEASARVLELLKIVGNDTPVTDSNYLELDALSDLMADYEDEHNPID